MNDGSPRLDDDGDLIVVAVDEPVESHRARAFSSNAWEHTMQAVMWMGLGVNSMRRFSGWALAIATTIFAFVGYIFQQVIADFIKQQPQEAANSALKFLHAALKFLHDLSEQTWFLVTASFLVGFAAGFLVKWLLQKLDGSRAKQREALADERVALELKWLSSVTILTTFDRLYSKPVLKSGHALPLLKGSGYGCRSASVCNAP